MSRPVIRIETGRQSAAVQQAVDALLASEAFDDLWCALLPRVVSHWKVDGEFVWVVFSSEYVAALLAEFVVFEDQRRRRIDPPAQLVRMVFNLLSGLGYKRKKRLDEALQRMRREGGQG